MKRSGDLAFPTVGLGRGVLAMGALLATIGTAFADTFNPSPAATPKTSEFLATAVIQADVDSAVFKLCDLDDGKYADVRVTLRGPLSSLDPQIQQMIGGTFTGYLRVFDKAPLFKGSVHDDITITDDQGTGDGPIKARLIGRGALDGLGPFKGIVTGCVCGAGNPGDGDVCDAFNGLDNRNECGAGRKVVAHLRSLITVFEQAGLLAIFADKEPDLRAHGFPALIPKEAADLVVKFGGPSAGNVIDAGFIQSGNLFQTGNDLPSCP